MPSQTTLFAPATVAWVSVRMTVFAESRILTHTVPGSPTQNETAVAAGGANGDGATAAPVTKGGERSTATALIDSTEPIALTALKTAVYAPSGATEPPSSLPSHTMEYVPAALLTPAWTVRTVAPLPSRIVTVTLASLLSP